MSRLHTPALSPYPVALVISTASARLANLTTDNTGPKISSRATRAVLGTPASTVGE
jgi:hypothetical protein